MPPTTVADVLRVNAAERPNGVSLVLDGRTITWSALYERARRVATALGAAGVGPGDRVAFLDKNGIEHFEVMFGATFCNAVPVDVNWRLAPPEIAYIVADSRAKVLVVGAGFAPVLAAIGDDLAADVRVIVIGEHSEHESYETWLGAHEGIDPHAATGPLDTALQLYSSGTTGRPKGVMLSNHNVLALLPAAVDMWGFSERSVNLVAMPLFHIGGSGWALVGMYVGARSVILRDLDPAALVALIGSERITHAFLVPAVLQFMLMVPGADDADYSSLENIVYGASPISDDVLSRSMAQLGCSFWQVYGLTETTGGIVNLPPADHDLTGPNRHRLRSCGRPGPCVEVRIVAPDTGADADTGAVGEIWVRGPQVMQGYWNNPAATADVIDAEGWFRTGDAGYLDADGYIYIHDRVKDMIVTGGENVYPAEVENVLMGHPAIGDVAVIGVPDERWGETVKAIAVLEPGGQLDVDDVIAFARERLARFKCPTSIDVVDALPRNPSGKILKKDLRAPYWEGRERQVN